MDFGHDIITPLKNCGLLTLLIDVISSTHSPPIKHSRIIKILDTASINYQVRSIENPVSTESVTNLLLSNLRSIEYR